MTRMSTVFATRSPADQHKPIPRRTAAPFAMVGDAMNRILGPALAITIGAAR